MVSPQGHNTKGNYNHSNQEQLWLYATAQFLLWMKYKDAFLPKIDSQIILYLN